MSCLFYYYLSCVIKMQIFRKFFPYHILNWPSFEIFFLKNEPIKSCFFLYLNICNLFIYYFAMSKIFICPNLAMPVRFNDLTRYKFLTFIACDACIYAQTHLFSKLNWPNKGIGLIQFISIGFHLSWIFSFFEKFGGVCVNVYVLRLI